MFHIGLEKTGTTSLQRFCFEHRRALLEQGLIYPANNIAFSRKSRNHASLVASYLRDRAPRDFSVSKYWRSRQETLGSLAEEIGHTNDAASVLISAEHFSSRFGLENIKRLRDDFVGRNPQIVIVLRDHARRLLSLYSTVIRNGHDIRYDDFIRCNLHPASPVIGYRSIIEPWLEIFGYDNLVLLRLGEGENIIDIFQANGIIPKVGSRGAYNDNIGYDSVTVETLRQANEFIGTGGNWRPNSHLQHRLLDVARAKALRGIHGLVRRECAEAPQGIACADPDLRRALEDAIARDREWLRRHFGLDPHCGVESRRLSAMTSADCEARARPLAERLGPAARAWLALARKARNASGALDGRTAPEGAGEIVASPRA